MRLWKLKTREELPFECNSLLLWVLGTRQGCYVIVGMDTLYIFILNPDGK